MSRSIWKCSPPARCGYLTSSGVYVDGPAPSPIEVLPDIVGIGILTSSLLTAGLAFSTVIFAYFMDSLPADSLAIADWGFLQKFHFRGCCRARYKGHADNSESKPCPHVNPNFDEKRQRGLNTFILSLSDQQLVIGPAMIIAALSQYCRLSCYEFQVVNSLAFLASSTHLATLMLLRQYFRENRFVRNVRVMGMICNHVLLFYTTVINSALTPVDKYVKVQCVKAKFIARDPFTPFFTILFLTIVYANAMCHLYHDRHHKPFQKLLRRFCCERKNGPQLPDEEFQKWYSEHVWYSRRRPGSKAQRRDLWQRVLKPTDSHKRSRPWLRVHKGLMLYRAVLFDFAESFILQIFILIINAWYGVMQVIVSRTGAPATKESVNAIDFGQVIPVFLLVLPILTASEIYFESHTDPPSSQSAQTHQNLDPNTLESADGLEGLKEENSLQYAASTSSASLEYSVIQRISLVKTVDKSNASTLAETSPTPEADMSSSLSAAAAPSLEPSLNALTLNPQYLYPYSQSDAQRALTVLVILTTIIATMIGITLSAAELTRFMAVPSVVPAVLLFAEKIIGHTRFLLHIIKETRKLKKGDWMIPAGGTRAPAPSIFEGHGV